MGGVQGRWGSRPQRPQEGRRVLGLRETCPVRPPLWSWGGRRQHPVGAGYRGGVNCSPRPTSTQQTWAWGCICRGRGGPFFQSAHRRPTLKSPALFWASGCSWSPPPGNGRKGCGSSEGLALG